MSTPYGAVPVVHLAEDVQGLGNGPKVDEGAGHDDRADVRPWVVPISKHLIPPMYHQGVNTLDFLNKVGRPNLDTSHILAQLVGHTQACAGRPPRLLSFSWAPWG